jgi:hypothetical protein
MKKKVGVLWLLAILVLFTACGGSNAEEPAAPASEDSASAETATDAPAAEEAAEESAPVAEEEAAEEPADTAAEETAEEATEESADDEMAEEAPAAEADGPWGERPLTGNDSDTGLAINPPVVNPGDTALIRGEIISLNLTPASSPEFLLQSPDGVNYRIRAQALSDVLYEDGTEIAPHLFQIGMLAQATVARAADAAVTDLPTTEDLVIIVTE